MPELVSGTFKESTNNIFKTLDGSIFNGSGRQGTKCVEPTEEEILEKESILFWQRQCHMSENMGSFNLKPETKIIVFARANPQGTEVAFFADTEVDPYRGSYHVPRCGCFVADLFFKVHPAVKCDGKCDPGTYRVVMVRDQLPNLRQLLTKFPMVALNTDTLDTIGRNPKLAQFIENHCLPGYSALELTVSDEIKELSRNKNGLPVTDEIDTPMVHTLYAEKRGWEFPIYKYPTMEELRKGYLM